MKGCLLLTCGLIILEMKADNELAISLPAYFESVKIWKYLLKKTKQNKTKNKNKPKTKRPKNKNKRTPPTGVEPQTINVWSQRIIYCATTTKVKQTQTLN